MFLEGRWPELIRRGPLLDYCGVINDWRLFRRNPSTWCVGALTLPGGVFQVSQNSTEHFRQLAVDDRSDHAAERSAFGT